MEFQLFAELDKNEGGAGNDISSTNQNLTTEQNIYLNDPDSPIDPALRRQLLVGQYYDFSIPWNIGFNLGLNYTNNVVSRTIGLQKRVTATFDFNGSIRPTDKWMVTFNGGYDFINKKPTIGTINMTRDLHCWQMSFNWVPIGYSKSWSFNISVKASTLKDLKYDKRSSRYDNLYDY